MTLQGKATAAAVVALVAVVSLKGAERHGASLERLKSSVARVETLTVASVKAETVYVKSASSATRTLTKYDTLRLTTAETLTVHVPGKPDTTVVFVPRSVADTVASVCRRLLTDCGRVHTADSALVLGLRQELKLQAASQPGFFAKWAGRIGWGLGGAGAALLLKR